MQTSGNARVADRAATVRELWLDIAADRAYTAPRE
jgi:hypothetical protein